MQLSGKVLELVFNSTLVGGASAGGWQQLDKWICVMKEREEGKREGGREKERENCKG